jgi:hypothetical protein
MRITFSPAQPFETSPIEFAGNLQTVRAKRFRVLSSGRSGRPKVAKSVLLVLALAWGCSGALGASDLAELVRDRTAIERVYYQHRLGQKPPFEEALPPALIEKLVRQDLHKEAVLKQAYGLEVTVALVVAEVQRINANTRAPEMLAELKAALGNDANRFARTVARPIVVERVLLDKFENDDALHAPRRREAERIRENLLAARGTLSAAAPSDLVEKLVALLKANPSNAVYEVTWQLSARPPATNSPSPDLLEVQKRFGPNAQIMSPPRDGGKKQNFYFEELPPALQKVLRVQLRQAGDVSAVIEMPAAFMLYVLREKTAEKMDVVCVPLAKKSFDQWLGEQKGVEP